MKECTGLLALTLIKLITLPFGSLIQIFHQSERNRKENPPKPNTTSSARYLEPRKSEVGKHPYMYLKMSEVS